jgi:hypothetical protein
VCGAVIYAAVLCNGIRVLVLVQRVGFVLLHYKSIFLLQQKNMVLSCVCVEWGPFLCCFSFRVVPVVEGYIWVLVHQPEYQRFCSVLDQDHLGQLCLADLDLLLRASADHVLHLPVLAGGGVHAPAPRCDQVLPAPHALAADEHSQSCHLYDVLAGVRDFLYADILE